MVIDENDGVVLMNPEAGRLLGIATDFGVFVEAIPGPNPNRPQRGDGARRRARGIGRGRRRLPAGSLFAGPRCTSNRLRMAALGPDQFILILRDVTARKEAEQQRETSRNMLALGEMAAVLAHEIRNPLGSMELWTSVLDKQGCDWRRREILCRASAGRDSLSVGDCQQCFAVSWPRIGEPGPVDS